jgi:LuxR family maltose regulon positive regulatory protein
MSGHSVSADYEKIVRPCRRSERGPAATVILANGSDPHESGRTARGPDELGAARAVQLGTKLHVPATEARLVRRAALLEALSAARGRKLTLLSAPAGWGKTTLLAQWALGAGDGRPFGWLSLDASDNDPVWFWMYVVAALQKAGVGVGAHAVQLLAMGADPVQVVLPTLLNDLDTIASPTVLILDDYHLVVNRAIHEQLAFVISRMPVNLHLVLATRSDPMLSLARLRACGDLVEMRSQDLRFGVEEAGQLLNDVLGLGLVDDDVQLLHRRTEGWAAGLYLAGFSLAGRTDAAAFIRTFAGDNRHIVDYLMAEVLEGQPPHLRRFLLRTSVLGRLSGPLCDAVLQTSGSASVLATIERENLFVVPLDMSRRWYRYHHLFGELLRAELRRSESDLIADLHQRAAAWFEAEGLIDEAVRHLVAAGDVAGSADLIAADWANEFNSGGLSTVSGWLDSIPEETVRKDARLSAARAWIALNVGRFDDARCWIQVVAAGCAADTVDDGSIGAQLVALREVYAFKTGDVSAALQAARRAIALDFADAQQARSAACAIYGSALYFSGSIDQAEATFRDAAQLAEKIGDRRRRIYSMAYLALIAAESGQLADAEHQIRRTSGVGTYLAGGEHFVNAIVSLAAAILLDGRGHSAAAADAAELAVGLARKGAGILELAKALAVRADIAADLGDHRTATASRREASTLLRDCADAAIAQTVLASRRRSKCVAVGPRSQGGPVVEELTAKEQQILRLMATRLSRREIGERLYVSLNTVKSHQRALYRKLGVDNRAAAVERARGLGLL